MSRIRNEHSIPDPKKGMWRMFCHNHVMGGFWYTLKIAKDHLREALKKHGDESEEAKAAAHVVVAFHKLARITFVIHNMALIRQTGEIVTA